MKQYWEDEVSGGHYELNPHSWKRKDKIGGKHRTVKCTFFRNERWKLEETTKEFEIVAFGLGELNWEEAGDLWLYTFKPLGFIDFLRLRDFVKVSKKNIQS